MARIVAVAQRGFAAPTSAEHGAGIGDDAPETDGGGSRAPGEVAAKPPAEERSASPVPPRRVPDQTRDDTDAGWGEHDEGSARDRWLQEQRPPHWE